MKIWLPAVYPNARGLRLAWNVFAVAYLWLRRGLLCRHEWERGAHPHAAPRCKKCNARPGPGGWYFE